MKHDRKILLLILLLVTGSIQAQVKRVQETKKNTPASSNELSVRAKAFMDESTPDANAYPWSKVVYRELDLKDGANSSLYYPEEPMEGQTNLFRLIIDLMTSGKITGYEYLDGREIYTDKYKLNIKDMLDKFHILYEEKKDKGETKFVIDDSDIPCNEVLSYYVKEKWLFDQRGSSFFSKIEAICPILHRSGDFGGEVTRYPMFWIPFESIRPYLTQHLVMSDGMNNAMRYTFDDFFALRQYKGTIFKTMNLQNQSLMQQYPNPDSLKIAQEKIENDIQSFQKALWVPENESDVSAKTTKESSKSTANEKEETVVEKRAIKRSNPREKSSASSSSSKSSGSSSSSAPVRSVRRTR